MKVDEDEEDAYWDPQVPPEDKGEEHVCSCVLDFASESHSRDPGEAHPTYVTRSGRKIVFYP